MLDMQGFFIQTRKGSHVFCWCDPKIAVLPCRARWPAWHTSRASRWPAWRPRRPPAPPRCAPRPPRCPSRCARPPRAAWAWPAAAPPRWRPRWLRRWPRAAAGRSRWPGRTPPRAPSGTARARARSPPGPAPPGAKRPPCSCWSRGQLVGWCRRCARWRLCTAHTRAGRRAPTRAPPCSLGFCHVRLIFSSPPLIGR